MSKEQFSLKKLTTCSMLAAISIILVYSFRMPMFLPFLEYDAADVPIMIATFLYGPAAGFLLTVAVSIIQGITVSSAAGIIGITMHIFATGSFVLVAGNLYKLNKSLEGAIFALVCGSATMVVSMVIWNIIVTPIYMGRPRAEIMALLIPAIIPFNIVKSSINATITFFVYKPISKVVHKIGLDN